MLEDSGCLMRKCSLMFNRCSSVLMTDDTVLLNEEHLCSKSKMRSCQQNTFRLSSRRHTGPKYSCCFMFEPFLEWKRNGIWVHENTDLKYIWLKKMEQRGEGGRAFGSWCAGWQWRGSVSCLPGLSLWRRGCGRGPEWQGDEGGRSSYAKVVNLDPGRGFHNGCGIRHSMWGY